MRYALLSDIHGNLEALQAVLEHAAAQQAERYLCVGDMIGYGANPCECLAGIQRCQAVCVCGNHEWGALSKLRLDWFNDMAKRALVWTKDQLGFGELDALRRLPLVATDGPVAFAHGTLTAPERFAYLMEVGQAIDTLRACLVPFCVVGNTHVPFVVEYDRSTDRLRRVINMPSELQEVRLSAGAGMRMLINPGSVGQPRDSDPRASYALLDTDAALLRIHRLSYDIPTAQQKIRQAGLPALLADRLALGR